MEKEEEENSVILLRDSEVQMCVKSTMFKCDRSQFSPCWTSFCKCVIIEKQSL